jgi:CRISPR-associated protein Cst2
MTGSVYSISISARATLDMHSLNNEGSEGNLIQTRMVNIIDQEGRLQNVNAISGDMFKHIQAEHLFRALREGEDVPLCAGCRQFNANRINADRDFQFILREQETYQDGNGKNKKRLKYTDADVIDYVLQVCAMDDIEGILIMSAGKESEDESGGESDSTDSDSERISSKKRSIPRKSVVEFGWVVGVPGVVETDSHFHVKYERADRAKAQEDRAAEAEEGSNLGQAIFYRPASSGIYAAVCHLELARIGFNDIRQTYAIEVEQRRWRMEALLQSVLYTFIQPNGALRSAQAPHLVDFSGVVTYSTGAVPAPTVSPLRDGYREEIRALGRSLEQVVPGAVNDEPFDSLSGFTDVVNMLLQAEPYTLRYNS